METLQLFRGDTIIVRYDSALIYVGFHRLMHHVGEKRDATQVVLLATPNITCV